MTLLFLIEEIRPHGDCIDMKTLQMETVKNAHRARSKKAHSIIYSVILWICIWKWHDALENNKMSTMYFKKNK